MRLKSRPNFIQITLRGLRTAGKATVASKNNPAIPRAHQRNGR